MLHKIESFMRGLMNARTWSIPPSPPEEKIIGAIDWDVMNQSCRH